MPALLVGGSASNNPGAAAWQVARRVSFLDVSAAFHCDLMRPAAQPLAAALDDIQLRTPRVPLMSTVSAALVSDVADLRDALVQQLYRPVRWLDAVQECVRLFGEDLHFVEFGTSGVLTGLLRRCGVPRAAAVCIKSLADVDALAAADEHLGSL